MTKDTVAKKPNASDLTTRNNTARKKEIAALKLAVKTLQWEVKNIYRQLNEAQRVRARNR